MKVIVPDTVEFAYTNVTENGEPIWNIGERYDIGDYVQYQGSVPHKVYKSLRAYNQAKRPPDHTTVEEIEAYSDTSTAIATGAKKFSVGGGLNIAIGSIVTISHSALPGSYKMTGEVTGYNPTGASPSPGTPSRSASVSPSHTVSTSPSSSPSATASSTPSSSPSRTASSSPSASPSHSPSGTASASPSDSPSHTESASPSATPSDSKSASPSGSASTSPSATVSGSPSASPSLGDDYDLEVNVLSTTGSGTFSTWVIETADTVPFWEEVGATNQHKMIDEYVNTATINANLIRVTFPVVRANAVALFGVIGSDVTVELWNTAGTVKYWEETVDLVYGAATVDEVGDWWEYFFGEFSAKQEVYVESDVTTAAGVMKITITAEDGIDAKCGNIVVGRATNLGITKYGVSAGIIDYSVKETDDDGVISLTEGAWSKEQSVTVLVDNTAISAVYRALAGLRATPTAWVPSEESRFESFITYGIYRDFSIVVPYPRHSLCNLEIEGLI